MTEGGIACTYSLSSNGVSLSSAGGSGTVTVTAPTGCPWSAVSNAGFVSITSGASGTGTGTVGYLAAPDTAVSGATGTLTIAGQTFTLTESGTPSAKVPPPFGVIDTPLNNSTGLSGAIGITGWALSEVGIQTIQVWRDPVPGESASGRIFVGNAVTVAGTRPDVAEAHPGYPNNNSGWGLQVLTNELPNANGQPGLGNGTYSFHVLVTDTVQQVVDLGVRTITVANAGCVLPIGTIDTPEQGGTASGPAFVNFGWVVTPDTANIIPIDGSTIWVYIDNLRVGHPVYNNYRSDIATLFPGFRNSLGAVGYYYIDTTKLTNGLHTIAWTATDSAGNTQGLGSRFFNVQN